MRRALLFGAVAIGLLQPLAALAVQPSEMLQDPALEARARHLSSELRCMVCQNESIDDSDAPLAHDLRVLVRDHLKAGESDTDILHYLVARYGDFILLKPPFKAATMLLWGTPALAVIGGAIALFLTSRRRPALITDSNLSAEEQAKLSSLLEK
jgi:cytochrome c-type biogenesis protein CcmH